MNHEVTIVHQNPVGGLIALCADGLDAQLSKLFADFVGNGVILSGVCPGTNHEVIRKTGYLLNVEDFDV